MAAYAHGICSPPPGPPHPVWWLHDEKPGHLSQVQGLLDALAEQIPLTVTPLPCSGHEHRPLPPIAPTMPRPLLVGAGRATHRPLRAARRRTGGLAVVLMNPGWPRWGYDLCVIPRHDGVRAGSRVLLTDGVLNKVRPSHHHTANHGVLLIGGPSRHHGWDASGLIHQLQRILKTTPGVRWFATSSRRTPAGTEAALHELARTETALTFIPASATPPGWVGEQLSTAGICWVSEDSVSMVYEALTAGCQVGLLAVPPRSPRRRPGRVITGVRTLIERGWVTPFDPGHPDRAVGRAPEGFCEARRVATMIRHRWLGEPPGPTATPCP